MIIVHRSVPSETIHWGEGGFFKNRGLALGECGISIDAGIGWYVELPAATARVDTVITLTSTSGPTA